MSRLSVAKITSCVYTKTIVLFNLSEYRLNIYPDFKQQLLNVTYLVIVLPFKIVSAFCYILITWSIVICDMYFYQMSKNIIINNNSNKNNDNNNINNNNNNFMLEA